MKFKKGFISEYEETIAEKKRQEDLRKRYKIEKENVVVVEKNNVIKTIALLTGRLVRITASVLIAILAGIGLIAIFYETPRNEILRMLSEFWYGLSK